MEGHEGTGTAVCKALSMLPKRKSNEQSPCWRAVTSANSPRSLAGYYSNFTEMPESLGYNNILVVVDRFFKEAVFIPCTKEENTLTTAELFRDHVWCQHGLPSLVISDRGSIFASHFMGELYKILEIKRKMSTAFHPQTDGQTERLNREINTYLRIYVSDRQQDWAKCIKIVQFVWNNTVSSVTTDSPFGIT